jgi:hypothetical protein
MPPESLLTLGSAPIARGSPLEIGAVPGAGVVSASGADGRVAPGAEDPLALRPSGTCSPHETTMAARKRDIAAIRMTRSSAALASRTSNFTGRNYYGVTVNLSC